MKTSSSLPSSSITRQLLGDVGWDQEHQLVITKIEKVSGKSEISSLSLWKLLNEPSATEWNTSQPIYSTVTFFPSHGSHDDHHPSHLELLRLIINTILSMSYQLHNMFRAAKRSSPSKPFGSFPPFLPFNLARVKKSDKVLYILTPEHKFNWHDLFSTKAGLSLSLFISVSFFVCGRSVFMLGNHLSIPSLTSNTLSKMWGKLWHWIRETCQKRSLINRRSLSLWKLF